MPEHDLYREIQTFLVDQFEIEESAISLDADLSEELELDSIDAVDLMVHVKEVTGKKVPPEKFKEIRTIRDLLNILSTL